MSELTDIEYVRDDTEPITISIKTVAGAPVDITGWTFKMTVNTEKSPADDANQVFEIDGVLDDDPLTGIVSFNPGEGLITQVGTFYYDIERVNAAGKRKTIRNGYKFKVAQDITK